MDDQPSRRRATRSSRSWHLPPSQRRELYVARHLAALHRAENRLAE